MRSRLAAFAWMLLPAIAGAQLPRNLALRWDQTTEFASRGWNNTNPGFLSAAFPHGLSAGLSALTHVQYFVQDPVPATIEPWNAGVCGLNARGDPDYATTRFYALGMALPATAPGGAFLITHTLMPPVAVAPTLAQWHHVWQLTVPAPPMEPGISLHMSQGATWGTPPTLLCQLTPSQPGHREIPRVEGTTQILENLAWSTQPPTGPPAPLDRLWYLQTSWAGIVLSGAADNATYNSSPCPNPNFGLAAVDPDFADVGFGTPPRFDDYVWEVRAGSLYGGGAGVLLLAMSVWPNGGVATPYGQLHIDITDPLFIGPVLMPALDGQGVSRLVFNLGPGSSGLRQVITTLPCLSAQAAVLSQAQPLRLSSLWTLRPRLLPPGFTGATATPATPFILNRPANVATTAIRNDGRGELQAQFYAGSTAIGPQLTIGERTLVRLLWPMAATTLRVLGTRTTPTPFVFR